MRVIRAERMDNVLDGELCEDDRLMRFDGCVEAFESRVFRPFDVYLDEIDFLADHVVKGKADRSLPDIGAVLGFDVTKGRIRERGKGGAQDSRLVRCCDSQQRHVMRVAGFEGRLCAPRDIGISFDGEDLAVRPNSLRHCQANVPDIRADIYRGIAGLQETLGGLNNVKVRDNPAAENNLLCKMPVRDKNMPPAKRGDRPSVSNP